MNKDKIKESQNKDDEFEKKFADKANTPMTLEEFSNLVDEMKDFYE